MCRRCLETILSAIFLFNRYVAQPERSECPPKFLLSKPHSFGLSKQKASYIQNIALHFKENNIKSHCSLAEKNYQEIFAELVQIKGIGKWTIEMFAIFYLLEPDIFPVKDLGLIRAINNLYSKDKPLSAEEIIALAEKWRPYRTAATFFLWRSIDVDIVAY